MVVASIIVASDFTLSKVENYEERAEEPQENTNAKHIGAFSLKAYKNCEKKKNKTDQSRCYDAVKRVLDSRIPISDLLAQNTVAEATKGLLWIGAIQAITAMIAVGFLMWTVYQTGRILGEAKQTTEAARKAADAAENAERAHVFPFVKVEMGSKKATEEIPGYDIMEPDPATIHVNFFIKNYGRTPARNIECRIMMTSDEEDGSPIWSEEWIDILGGPSDDAGIFDDFFASRRFLTEVDRKKPFAKAVVEYDDVFGNGRVSSTSHFYVEFLIGEGIRLPSVNDSEEGITDGIQSIKGVRVRTEYEKDESTTS